MKIDIFISTLNSTKDSKRRVKNRTWKSSYFRGGGFFFEYLFILDLRLSPIEIHHFSPIKKQKKNSEKT